ncbi:MAG: hypothetical protein ACXAD7_14190 [Candidatus Kariarchaeaceae archaeon]
MSIFTPRSSGKRELSIANDLIKEKKYQEALDLVKQGLVEIRKKGNPKEIAFTNAKVLEIQGLLHMDKGNLKNASGAFGQSGRYFKQAEAKSDEVRVMKLQATLLQDIGKHKADNHAFESAAAAFEEAALSYKSIGLDIESLEVRAKAYVFRAASVRNVSDRKNFLIQAVDLFKKSGIDKPIVLGHLEYYNAMAQRLTDKNQAVLSLEKAINHYRMANNKSMIQSATAMKMSLQKQMQNDN